MNVRIGWLTAAALLVATLALHHNSPPLAAVPEVPVPEKLPRQAKARADAARKTYEYYWQNNKEAFRLSTELVYRWSSRWLDAERDLNPEKAAQRAACEAHLQRMRQLEQLTVDRYKNRVTTIDEVTAAEFFRAEAEVWVTKATMP